MSVYDYTATLLGTIGVSFLVLFVRMGHVSRQYWAEHDRNMELANQRKRIANLERSTSGHINVSTPYVNDPSPETTALIARIDRELGLAGRPGLPVECLRDFDGSTIVFDGDGQEIYRYSTDTLPRVRTYDSLRALRAEVDANRARTAEMIRSHQASYQSCSQRIDELRQQRHAWDREALKVIKEIQS